MRSTISTPTNVAEQGASGGARTPPPSERWQLGRPAAYVVLALGLTWAVWIPALLLLGGHATPIVMLGAFGPAVAAALLVRREGRSIRGWLRELLVFHRPGRWYLAALAIPLVEPLALTGVAIAHGIPLAPGELPLRLPLVLVSFVVVLLVGGGQEEFGWRGYLLPRLQAHRGPLVASVMVGVVWAVWHLPLFVLGMPGYTYDRVPFPLYLAILVAASVVFTWVWNGSGGSVIPVMLLHAAFNSWDDLTPVAASTQLSGRVELLSQGSILAIYALLAALLAARVGPRLARATSSRTLDAPRAATDGSTGA